MNPNASVKPGIINNNAAIAIDAPEINCKQELYFDKGSLYPISRSEALESA